MKVLLFSIVIFLSCVVVIHTAPLFGDGFRNIPIPSALTCQKFGCPANATACSKQVSTSQDGKTIETVVKCYGPTGNLLGEPLTSVSKNPDLSSVINSYEFVGTFSSTNALPAAPTNITDDQIETFE